MADNIKRETGITAKLIEGRGGIFDVVIDGKKVYCKHDTGRFPEPDEILGHLQKPAK
mgnify:CR=1 FL=1